MDKIFLLTFLITIFLTTINSLHLLVFKDKSPPPLTYIIKSFVIFMIGLFLYIGYNKSIGPFLFNPAMNLDFVTLKFLTLHSKLEISITTVILLFLLTLISLISLFFTHFHWRHIAYLEAVLLFSVPILLFKSNFLIISLFCIATILKFFYFRKLKGHVMTNSILILDSLTIVTVVLARAPHPVLPTFLILFVFGFSILVKFLSTRNLIISLPDISLAMIVGIIHHEIWPYTFALACAAIVVFLGRKIVDILNLEELYRFIVTETSATLESIVAFFAASPGKAVLKVNSLHTFKDFCFSDIQYYLVIAFIAVCILLEL